MENQKNLLYHIGNSMVHFLFNFFIYFLFIVPLDLWKKATISLSTQRDTGYLSISRISGQWPLLTFIKRFFVDFFFNGIIFILYFIGPIAGVAALILSEEYLGREGYIPCLIIILITYYSPIALSIIREIIILQIMPFKKFLNWVMKPAQYMDLTILNKSDNQEQWAQKKESKSFTPKEINEDDL